MKLQAGIPHSFIIFYCLDVTTPTMAHAVVEVGSLEI